MTLLNTSSDKFSSSKSGHKFKKSNLSLFKESKMLSKNTSDVFKESNQSKFLNSNMLKTSSNFGHLDSTTSNWFGMSSGLQSQDFSGKLRNFKKGNNNYQSSVGETPIGSKPLIVG